MLDDRRSDAEPGGVDITPLYRADAKIKMVRGAAGIVVGAILSFVGVPIVGFVAIAFGFVQLLRGIVQLAKYR